MTLSDKLTTYHSISSESEFSAALEESMSTPVVLFKHSCLCELSAAAWTEMQALNSAEGINIYEVTVQSARPLSNHIEQYFGIRHESPQVIVLYHGNPVFDTSHRQVTAVTIRDAVHRALSS